MWKMLSILLYGGLLLFVVISALHHAWALIISLALLYVLIRFGIWILHHARDPPPYE
jgi:hypothetical protein